MNYKSVLFFFRTGSVPPPHLGAASREPLMPFFVIFFLMFFEACFESLFDAILESKRLPKSIKTFQKLILKQTWRKLRFPTPFWINFSYLRSWFCHSSWEALFNISCILACILEHFFVFPLLILSLRLGSSVWHHLYLECILDEMFIFSLLILSLLLRRSVAHHLYFRMHVKSDFHIFAFVFTTPLGSSV